MIRARRPAWRIATMILLFAARESSGQGLTSAGFATVELAGRSGTKLRFK